MSGGRPKGAISKFKNPANIAALHMQALEVEWLIHTDYNDWQPGRPFTQRYLTAEKRRELAAKAIERMVMLHSDGCFSELMHIQGYTREVLPRVLKRPTVEQVLRAYRRMGRPKGLQVRKGDDW
jgi:hypothetical protein